MNAVQSLLKKPISLRSRLAVAAIAVALLYPAWQLGGVIADEATQRAIAAIN